MGRRKSDKIDGLIVKVELASDFNRKRGEFVKALARACEQRDYNLMLKARQDGGRDLAGAPIGN